MSSSDASVRSAAWSPSSSCSQRETSAALETDSRAFHSRSGDVKRDLARDRLVENAGWRVRRASFNQVTYEAAALAERIKAWLTA